MKTSFLLLLIFAAITGCKSPASESIKDRLSGSWVAGTVFESSTQVYSRDNPASQRPGYSKFSIILNPDGSVVFTDFDDVQTTGKWDISGEATLVFRDLSPEPTGTNGVIEFTVSEIEAGSITLTRNSSSAKTGNTVNTYLLVVRQ